MIGYPGGAVSGHSLSRIKLCSRICRVSSPGISRLSYRIGVNTRQLTSVGGVEGVAHPVIISVNPSAHGSVKPVAFDFQISRIGPGLPGIK
jgi:hypothetical protein